MLIPPSLMFILYGTLAEVSIGKMFIAGIIPGIILAVFFSIYVAGRAVISPRNVFTDGLTYKDISAMMTDKSEELPLSKLLLSVIPVILLIGIVLGGIWGGLFTPTEAAAIGALGALIIGFFGGMGVGGFKRSVHETAQSCSGILFLLMTAQMYSRMLTMSGLVNWLSTSVMSLDVNRYVILAMFMIVIIGLGCILDSSSIMLIMVPLMAPIMQLLGFDMIWFGIITVLFVHFGLITPPFGICVFSIKSSLPAEIPVSLEKIFGASMPFLLTMLIHALLMIFVPVLSTWLPSMM
jgi:tripartite ATP-independent transporter DctM subunit